VIDKSMKSIGFRDMHELQIEAISDFIGMAIKMASFVGDQDLVDEVTEAADELVKLFGGNGVDVEVTISV
jgi:hypothetical protein